MGPRHSGPTCSKLLALPQGRNPGIRIARAQCSKVYTALKQLGRDVCKTSDTAYAREHEHQSKGVIVGFMPAQPPTPISTEISLR